MRLLAVLFTVLGLTWAQDYLPGKFIVELSEEPMGALAKEKSATREASAKLARIRAEQQRVKEALWPMGVKALGSMANVVNAIAVKADDSQYDQLKALPGVKNVYRARRYKLHMDRAIELNRIVGAWTKVGGGDRAGLGMKIGIIDTGISPNHPAFRDATLPVVTGYPIVTKEEYRRFTNNKIIVARDYQEFFESEEQEDPVDIDGHGTGVAMCAAGVVHQGPFGRLWAPRRRRTWACTRYGRTTAKARGTGRYWRRSTMRWPTAWMSST